VIRLSILGQDCTLLSQSLDYRLELLVVLMLVLGQYTIDKGCSNLLMVYINQQGKRGRGCLLLKPRGDLPRLLHVGTRGSCK
jgi:hypothetical protein